MFWVCSIVCLSVFQCVFSDFGLLVEIIPKVMNGTSLNIFICVGLGQRKTRLHIEKDPDHNVDMEQFRVFRKLPR